MLTQSSVAGFIQTAYPLLAAGSVFYCSGKILKQIREQDDEKAWQLIMGLEVVRFSGLTIAIAKTMPGILQYWFMGLPK